MTIHIQSRPYRGVYAYLDIYICLQKAEKKEKRSENRKSSITPSRCDI